MPTSRSQQQSSNMLSRIVISWPVRIILALVYSAAVMILAEDTLATKVSSLQADETVLSSPEAAMVFLRLLVVGWTVLLTFFQAYILALLFGLSVGIPRPKVGESWGYVLIAQIPLSLMVFLLLATDHTAAMPLLYEPYIQHLLGAVTAIIFAFLASSGTNALRKRVAAFTVLAIAANSAMLALSSQAAA